ncbi:aldehyde dehydrogenase family protein [Gudongella sp. DL1XJH-153]|uniref:aldehyde dehydrogenase family protein n=1 Tax=Gudongella sp. DL1XJH-153 TaxID=3409804 RepID=UPI003BB809CA
MLSDIYNGQRKYFDQGHTLTYDFRLSKLKKLKRIIKENEDIIMESIQLDLAKPEFESYTSEIGIVYEELDNAIKNLDDWMKPRRVSTPLYLSFAKSLVYSHPKGVVLIISPWNYPFQLMISPLIGAMAAGNCAILKPSSQSKNTQKVISKLISNNFDRDYIAVVEGSGSVTNPLIENHRLDHIFFTGSIAAGREISKLAAEELTPVTLELGGKSPTIVHSDAEIDSAAKRITWAKFFNLGQTCLAPDYLLVHTSVKDDLISRLKHYIEEFYENKKKKPDSLGRIINEKRFDKLVSYLDQGKILEGGDFNRADLFIEPTLIDEVNMQDSIMKEEIFGPILPIIGYDAIEDTIDIIRKNRYPLALYLFTKDDYIKDYILERIEFGGGCINHALSHVVNANLPFGGIGYSGHGRYHSKVTFDTFSYEKGIFEPSIDWEPDLKYPPYNDSQLKLVKRIMK